MIPTDMFRNLFRRNSALFIFPRNSCFIFLANRHPAGVEAGVGWMTLCVLCIVVLAGVRWRLKRRRTAGVLRSPARGRKGVQFHGGGVRWRLRRSLHGPDC